MRKRLLVIAFGLVAGCNSAFGAELVESMFQVDFTRDGQGYVYKDTMVPFLPENACYNWYARFDGATTDELTLVETYTLPEPLASWVDYENIPDAATQINADGTGAVTTVVGAPDSNGWITHGWCVAEGDPLGRYAIAVALDGAEIARWEFDVVAEANYPFEGTEPTPPPPPPLLLGPTDRSVDGSW